MKKNQLDISKLDGAIIFREDGTVEILLPDIDLDESLPAHLEPMMAISLIVGNNDKLQIAIDEMRNSIEFLNIEEASNE